MCYYYEVKRKRYGTEASKNACLYLFSGWTKWMFQTHVVTEIMIAIKLHHIAQGRKAIIGNEIITVLVGDDL